MAHPPHHWEWIHPFQAFWHNKSSSAAGRTDSGLPTPSLRMMMTYYVETPEMGVFILSDGVGKPFSVSPATDDDLLCRNVYFLVTKHSNCQFHTWTNFITKLKLFLMLNFVLSIFYQSYIVIRYIFVIWETFILAFLNVFKPYFQQSRVQY